MPEFHVRSDSVNVEQIMDQIRARIREKRGVDYTEEEIRQLAAVKLEKFLEPRGLRSDLLEEFRRTQAAQTPPPPPNFAFEAETLFETHRGPLRWIRRLLKPLLKLFFNPNPLIQALHIQAELNTLNASRETARRGVDQLYYEVLHNLVLETTRSGIELKNLRMRIESLTSRLEFNERRARALEGVVVYKPGGAEPGPGGPGLAGLDVAPADANGDTSRAALAPEGPGQRSRRRRRRRGRKGGMQASAVMAGATGAAGGHEGEPESDADGESGASHADAVADFDRRGQPAGPAGDDTGTPEPSASAGESSVEREPPAPERDEEP
jgi:hypothetical protein